MNKKNTINKYCKTRWNNNRLVYYINRFQISDFNEKQNLRREYEAIDRIKFTETNSRITRVHK